MQQLNCCAEDLEVTKEMNESFGETKETLGSILDRALSLLASYYSAT